MRKFKEVKSYKTHINVTVLLEPNAAAEVDEFVTLCSTKEIKTHLLLKQEKQPPTEEQEL